MKIVVKGGIEIPHKILPHINLRAFTYLTKSWDYKTSFLQGSNKIILPRNYKKFIDNFNITEFKFDFKFSSPPLEKEFKINKEFKLRDHQEKVLNNVIEFSKGNITDFLIVMGTGLGKTAMLPAIVKELNTKTLILVDLKMLGEQMYNSFNEFSKCNLQLVDKNTDRIADVNIATFQLLRKNPRLIELFKDSIGVVIVDEAHIIASDTLKETIFKINSKYRIGLSATPTRSDGLTGILHDIFPYKIEVEGKSFTSLHILGVAIPYVPTYGKNYNELVNKLIEKTIPDLDVLVENLVATHNKSIMIATDKIYWQEFFANKYKKYGVGILNSKTSKKDRDKILEAYDKGEIKILLGYKVLNKGINIPRMEALINLYSATTKENIEQLLGRLNRAHKEKESAIYIDLIPTKIFKKQLETKKDTLKKVANKLNATIIGTNIETLKNLTKHKDFVKKLKEKTPI